MVLKKSTWIMFGITAGWLVAYPIVEILENFFQKNNIPIWVMILIGLYLSFAVSKRDLIWVFR